ncbi:hypothetical protein DN752_16845 [Echinicola strongylocentroti]|uniref:Yip1 domain-containing protein n=1 Tax=Echinicola strongylocentroti TaxID=1795355 RepID=A0A2Z4ILR2_9BACT|nr:hypothetical protein [Echinicola strongylocentroti]AWW31659.1 hypothetical protein DN752_16845 [Echinicola strongylocentroti]
MKPFLILLVYSLALYLSTLLLIDFEGMLLNEMLNEDALELSFKEVQTAIDEVLYWNRFSALFAFLMFTVKCFLVAVVLYAGLFFADRHKGVRLGTLFGIAVYAEVVFVIAGLVKLVYVSAYGLSYQEFAAFYPLSLINLFDVENIRPVFNYPLQLVNLFELVYVFVLVYLVKEELELSMPRSSSIVLGSYGTALFCWVVFVVFITLNMS